MKLIRVLSLLFVISCKEATVKNYVTIRKGDVIIKGDITKDTVFNDTIYFYNLRGDLISQKFYKNGSREGVSTDFYLSGIPMSISSYKNGLKNGPNFFYDSSGRCLYQDFYYYGLGVGPVIYFNNTNGTPKRYFFISLDNKTLFHINYENWIGINNEIATNLINFTGNVQRRDSLREMSIFLYLINPPKISLLYSILKKKKNDDENNFVEVEKIPNNNYFEQIVLPVLREDEQYVVSVNIYDSILNKKAVVYKDVER
jgi:hypothetical protein